MRQLDGPVSEQGVLVEVVAESVVVGLISTGFTTTDGAVTPKTGAATTMGVIDGTEVGEEMQGTAAGPIPKKKCLR